MGTEVVAYIPYVEAVLVHIELMRFLGETHYGVFSRELVASALTRPQQAAHQRFTIHCFHRAILRAKD